MLRNISSTNSNKIAPPPIIGNKRNFGVAQPPEISQVNETLGRKRSDKAKAKANAKVERVAFQPRMSEEQDEEQDDYSDENNLNNKRGRKLTEPTKYYFESE